MGREGLQNGTGGGAGGRSEVLPLQKGGGGDGCFLVMPKRGGGGGIQILGEF